MTSLTDLPIEVLIIILKLLDSKSIYNVYDTCRYFRELTCMQGVVKKINLSMNTLATVHSLKSQFIKNISGQLYELNLCGMPDLKKSCLLPAMKRLKCLTTLDISYTNINVIEFMEIYQLCPSIKNISMNFVFGKIGLTSLRDGTINQCQNLFKNFDNIHLVGSVTNLLYSPLSMHVLKYSKLDMLKYSVSECNYAFTTNHRPLYFENLEPRVQFKQFNICLLNWREKNKYYQKISAIPLLSSMELKKYEFIIITMCNLESFNVFTSPIFQKFFIDCFYLEAQIVNEIDQPLFGNISIMIWDKEFNNFDDDFFSKLYGEIKDYFPVRCTLDQAPKTLKHDWFYLSPNVEAHDNDNLEMYQPKAAKRRMAIPKCYLNYDKVFKDKEKIMLSIIFHDYLKNAVTLYGNDYLRKITFLNLSGSVRYSTDFFSVLFSSCDNLKTLNVEATSVSPCAVAISRSLHLAKCLEHIRLVDRRIDFKSLFTALSKCKLLSNIHIVEDTESDPCNISDPSVLIAECNNLYNLYIEAPMTETERTKNIRLLTKVKNKLKKYHVNVILHHKAINDRYRYYYDPFLDVFKLSSIKQI